MDYCATGGAESKVSYFGSGMGIASSARFSQWGDLDERFRFEMLQDRCSQISAGYAENGHVTRI